MIWHEQTHHLHVPQQLAYLLSLVQYHIEESAHYQDLQVLRVKKPLEGGAHLVNQSELNELKAHAEILDLDLCEWDSRLRNSHYVIKAWF